MQARPLTRRTMLASGMALAGLASGRAQPVPPAGRSLTFEMWRDGSRIGRHGLTFAGGAKSFVVTIDSTAKVGFGPLTILQYHHQAIETWLDGQFQSYQSHAVTNGEPRWVAAARSPDGVLIKTATGSRLAPPTTLPLTHWNRQALGGPLFDFLTGAALRETITRQAAQAAQLANGQTVAATRYLLAGDLDIALWYAVQDEWVAMRLKAMDGSYAEYRRVV